MSSQIIQKNSVPINSVLSEEQKLRYLAVELAKDIVEPHEIMKALNISEEEYQGIKNTRAFKTMYAAALAEWHGASNTQKRVKFKAAAMIEDALPVFYTDLKDREVPITGRVELLKTIARFGNIGNPEIAPPSVGQHFKLEIHLAGDKPPIVIDSSTQIVEELTESKLAENDEADEL